MKTIKVFDANELPIYVWDMISAISSDDLFYYDVNGFVGEYDKSSEEEKRNYSLTDIILTRESDIWFKIQGCIDGERIIIDHS